ncbi:MAG: class I SAM-dependent methyltransferase, partial [Fimbriimonas ginsengisoli]|nr:class I SAM-dependent methyltransferase [Fimbriimonas ginsengisoli]
MNPEEYARMHQFEDWYWWFVARRRSALRFAADYCPAGRPLRILDAGCGTGALLERLSRDPRTEAFGIDISRAALAFSRGRGQERLAQANLTALPFRDGGFEVITALDVVEHVEDDVGALREMGRVLAPGGV